MTQMSGEKAIIKSLEKQKVEVIFGILGGAVLPIYDHFCNSEIRHILCRHEQGAIHAAEGYARASGKPGVCMATSGPGATNLVTGIANAYMDSAPVVALTGQVPTTSKNTTYMIGRDSFQEADIVGITSPITKYNHQIQTVAEIPEIIKNAFYIATTGRPGPVLIDVPKNLQSEVAEMVFSNKIRIRGYKPKTKPHPMQIERAVKLLMSAEKPVILSGGGVITSNATHELTKTAEILMAPVATSFMGKGSIPENHPLSVGSIGMHGNPVANKLLCEADVVLAVGTRFSDRATGTVNTFCAAAKIIHIDIDAAEIGKNIEVNVPIVADARKTLKEINNKIIKKLKNKDAPWAIHVKELKQTLNLPPDNNEKEIKPKAILYELRKLLPNDAIVATEVGQNQMWSALYFNSLKPRTFISSGGLGTMGFGFPASIGAKVACPNKVVVDIAGDGSFRMTEQELATSVTEQIPVIVVVLNNSVLGMVAQWQRLFFRGRYSAIKLGSSPDFVKLAEAYGAQGLRARSLPEFKKAVKEALNSDITTVIDVPISSEENVDPMVPPGCGINEQVGNY